MPITAKVQQRAGTSRWIIREQMDKLHMPPAAAPPVRPIAAAHVPLPELILLMTAHALERAKLHINRWETNVERWYLHPAKHIAMPHVTPQVVHMLYPVKDVRNTALILDGHTEAGFTVINADVVSQNAHLPAINAPSAMVQTMCIRITHGFSML